MARIFSCAGNENAPVGRGKLSRTEVKSRRAASNPKLRSLISYLSLDESSLAKSNLAYGSRSDRPVRISRFRGRKSRRERSNLLVKAETPRQLRYVLSRKSKPQSRRITCTPLLLYNATGKWPRERTHLRFPKFLRNVNFSPRYLSRFDNDKFQASRATERTHFPR